MAETAPPAASVEASRRHGRPGYAFRIAIPIGMLGGLIGLGGAEFRLPILIWSASRIFSHRKRSAHTA